jgi:transcriptional regulator with XRE-family HTH domain
MKTTNKGKIISDEEFIELHSQGLTQAEICRQTGISAAQASRRCKKLNLKSNSKANYKKINKDKFLELYDLRTTDAEIARQFECSESKIKTFRESLGLTKVDRRHFTDEEFLEIYNQNLSDKQIAEILNVSEGYITQRRNKLSLSYHKERREVVPLTDTEFQVILGTVLGDTHLYKKYTHGDCAGTCNHCLEQEELIFTKYNYLKNISQEPRLVDKCDKRLQTPTYQQWYWYINANPALNGIYDMFYKDKVKYINKELFEKIEPLGLAIWYMDDGSKYQDYGGYLLCTHGFLKKDIDIIQDVLLAKFSINTSTNSKNGLYILSDSKLAFKKLIEPYIVESMKYKL